MSPSMPYPYPIHNLTLLCYTTQMLVLLVILYTHCYSLLSPRLCGQVVIL